ncbi:MAG: thymidine kinase [bacterium]
MKRGKLFTVSGPMFAGKTNLLIKEYGGGQDAVVFKPDLDRHYTKKPLVVSHDRLEIPSVLVNNDRPEEMLELVGEVGRVFIDGISFFSEALIAVVEKLLDQGKEVWVVGLDRYADGEPWGPMLKIKMKADKHYELFARCDGLQGKCSKPATRSYYKKPHMHRLTVAGVEEYGAACEEHYQILHHEPRRERQKKR